MTSLDEQMRRRVKRFLPQALERVIASHKANTPNHPYNPDKKKNEPLEVKRQHDACKSALSHMQLLMVFAQDLEKQPDQSSGENEKEELAKMIETAKAEIQNAGEV